MSNLSNSMQALSPQARDLLQAEAWKAAQARVRAANRPLPGTWQERVYGLFPKYFWYEFSVPHTALWQWLDAIDAKSAPQPFVALWSRGRGKSTNGECGIADLVVRKARTYFMYISATQDQADKHVQTIARILESDDVNKYAPDVGEPRVSRNGSRTWNRQMVQTANGCTIEAVGLDRSVRGQKIDWARPDFLCFDDIDDRHDSEKTVEKKIVTLTESILPAGAAHRAVLFLQNLIHDNSIASRLARQPGQPEAADFLTDRIVSGPFPAVEDLKYELQQVGDVYRWRIVDGRSVWHGFDLSVCEDEINTAGPAAFERESQHNVDADNPNALLSAEDFDRTRVSEYPELGRIAVAVDPPGGRTYCGIVAGGKTKIGKEWHGYTLEDATSREGARSAEWALDVLKCYHRHDADVIFVETNFGGDMATEVIKQTRWLDDEGNVIVDGANVRIESVNASRGKLVRAEPVAVVFEQGRGHHVGHFPALEKEWRQYEAGDRNSPNRLDAEVWLYTGLDLLHKVSVQTVAKPSHLTHESRRQSERERMSGRRQFHGSRR